MAKGKKRLAPVLIRLGVVGFLVYAGVTIVSLQIQISEKQERVNSLAMRIDQYEQSNKALREQMEAGISEEEISEAARAELNYAEPGERIFVDTSRRQ